jgi:hypothetical protein
MGAMSALEEPEEVSVIRIDDIFSAAIDRELRPVV